MSFKLIFLIFLTLLSSVTVLGAFDFEKTTIMINPASLVSMESMAKRSRGSTDPLEPKEDAVEFLNSLLESDQHNIYIDNSSFGAMPGFEDLMNNDVIPHLGNASALLRRKDLSQTEISQIDRQFRGEGGGSLGTMDFQNPLKKIFHAFVHVQGGGISPLVYNSKGGFNSQNIGQMNFPDEDLESLIFALGPLALADDFSIDSLVFSIDHNSNPKTCSVSFNSQVTNFDLTKCLEKYIKTDYRWIDRDNRTCGLFDSLQNVLLEDASSILCEPQHVQDFEAYYQASFLASCNQASGCFNSISGQGLEQLSNDFLSIMIASKIDTMKSKNYSDSSYDYKRDFDDLLKDIADFTSSCLPHGIDALLLSEINEGDLEAYESGIQALRDSFKEVASDYLVEPELSEKLESVSFSYKKCILNEIKIEAISRGDMYYEQCARESFGDVIKELIASRVEPLGSRAEAAKEYIEGSLDSLCHLSNPTRPESPFKGMFGLNSGNTPGISIGSSGGGLTGGIGLNGYGKSEEVLVPLGPFNFSYDFPRCLKRLEDLSKNYDAYQALDNLDATTFTSLFSPQGNPRRLTAVARQLTQECLSVLDDDSRSLVTGTARTHAIKDCLEKGEQGARASSLYDSIALRVSAEGVTLNRLSNGSEFVLALAQSEPAIQTCLSETSLNATQIQECQSKISQRLAASRLGATFGAGAADAALAEDLRMLTKELSREISVFHWASDELSGNNKDEPVSLTSWSAYKYAVGREYMFHTGPLMDRVVADAGATMAGRGLYAASDPNSTRSYGDTLFEIRVPSGSRFLDLREAQTHGGIPISKDTFDKLKEVGCDLKAIDEANSQSLNQPMPTPGNQSPEEINEQNEMFNQMQSSINYAADYLPDSLYYASVPKSIFEKNRSCNRVFSAAVSSLNINFLSYNYSDQPPSFCDQGRLDNRTSAAFVMIDNQMRGNVRTYNAAQLNAAVEAFEKDGTPIPEDMRRILQLDTAITDPNGMQRQRQTSTDDETVNYWKSRIFNCDSTFEEDRVTGGFQ